MQKNDTIIIYKWHDSEHRKAKWIYKLLELTRNLSMVIGIKVNV